MRLIDANLAMRKIREYMEDYPNATARLAACRACLSILGDKQQVPTIDPEACDRTAGGVCVNLTYGRYECSVCHTADEDCSDYYGAHNVNAQDFCPYCGAKMDGGKTYDAK